MAEEPRPANQIVPRGVDPRQPQEGVAVLECVDASAAVTQAIAPPPHPSVCPGSSRMRVNVQVDFALEPK